MTCDVYQHVLLRPCRGPCGDKIHDSGVLWTCVDCLGGLVVNTAYEIPGFIPVTGVVFLGLVSVSNISVL